MSDLYSYERKQRRSALTLLFNVVALAVMATAAHRLLPATDAGQQLLHWIDIAVPVATVGLLLVAAWFWVKNGSFRIAVDAERFELVDPLSEGASFSVPVADIVEIRQVHRKHVDHSMITMRTKSGDVLRLSLNYRYDRAALYAALAQANPEISLPEDGWRFQQVASISAR